MPPVEQIIWYDNQVDNKLFFVSSGIDHKNSPLKLLSRLGLLAGEELDSLGGLPSLASPSDHLPLAANFLWNFG